MRYLGNIVDYIALESAGHLKDPGRGSGGTFTADGIEGLGLVPYSVKFSELKQLTNLKSTSKHSRKKRADGIEVRGLADEMMARGRACQPAPSPVGKTSEFIKF